MATWVLRRWLQLASGAGGGPDGAQAAEVPVLLGERLAYRRYFAIYDRRYRYPDGHIADFDVVGHPSLENFRFVVVCPVLAPGSGGGSSESSAKPTFTFVREFAAGSGAWHYALPTGGVERGETPNSAAARELAEEAGLEAERLVPLLPEGHPGILEVKWSRNRFRPFLALGARPAKGALPERPAEEKAMRVLSVDEEGALDLLRSGDLFLPSSVTLQLALDWLRTHGSEGAADCAAGTCPWSQPGVARPKSAVVDAAGEQGQGREVDAADLSERGAVRA